MKRILICVIAAFGLVAYAEGQKAECPKAKKDCKAEQKACCAAQKPCCPAVTEKEVTGSKIPAKVTKNGVPIKSTLKVQTIDEESVRTFGLGSPSGALARVPYVYLRGRH